MEDKIKFLQNLYESGGLWFVLGTLISADTYMCSKEEAIKRYKESMCTFNKILEAVDYTNIPEKAKQKVKETTQQGLELLTKELNELLR